MFVFMMKFFIIFFLVVFSLNCAPFVFVNGEEKKKINEKEEEVK